MKKIQMVDVISQHKKYSKEISQRIDKVISSGAYIQGEEVKKFEKLLSSYLDSKYTITCGNGTDALYIALMSLNLKKGDEVLVPSFTFVSTVEVVCLLGLTPIFVDINPKTFLIDVQSVKESINHNTKVIIPVHLFGQCCNMIDLKRIAKKYDLFLVEDAAQSIGSRCSVGIKNNMKFSGTIGDIGITSFYPSKNLGGIGDGGAIFTQKRDLADRIRLIANHGQEKKYMHKIVGLNSRLDALQATILAFKLRFLSEFNKNRQAAARCYDDELASLGWLKTPNRAMNTEHVFHQYSILLKSSVDRFKFQKYLHNLGIPTMIYYPIPLHKQEAYKSYATKSLPNSENVSEHIISLPMHPELDSQQVKFICDMIKRFV